MKNNEMTREEDPFAKAAAEGKRRQIATQCLAGFHASGRKFTVQDGKEITLEEAAVMSADRLIQELNKEKK